MEKFRTHTNTMHSAVRVSEFEAQAVRSKPGVEDEQQEAGELMHQLAEMVSDGVPWIEILSPNTLKPLLKKPKNLPKLPKTQRGLYRASESKAACVDLVRVSAAAQRDASSCVAVRKAATFPEKDAEKRVHGLLNTFGMSLKVPISWENLMVNGDPVRIPYLKPSDYLKKLLECYPQCIWAGTDKPEQRCLAFWKAFYQCHPTHEVFQKFTDDQLRTLIPMILHGDEGTGSKKQPVSIVNWQTPWGHPTEKSQHLQQQECFSDCSACKRHHAKVSKCCNVPTSWPRVDDGKLVLDEQDMMELLSQFPTTSTHSYLSRHLVFVLPTHLVKKGPQVLNAALNACGQDLKRLFEHGIEVGDRRFFGALIACKGDAKWHKAVANFERCYSHLGEVSSKPICPECLGGDVGFPFEDTSSDAAWIQTLFESEPWSTPGPWECIPYDSEMPARKYRRDLLHVFKIGLGRDIGGSTICLLARFFKWFDFVPGDSVELGNRLKRAHNRLVLWAAVEKRNLNLRGFTKDFMHLPRVDGYAWTNSKGSDTMHLLAWLELELGLATRSLVNHSRVDLLRAARRVCKASQDLFRVLYSHGLFLPRACVTTVRDHVLTITRGYNYLATECLKESFPAYSMKTTIHSLHHFAVEADLCLQTGGQCLPNPLLYECSQCEDFIGRTARVCRATHAHGTALRSLQRHLVKTKLLLKKQFLKSKRKRR